MFFSPINLLGQTYENIVFEGGGIRGIAYCGALEELEKAGALTDLKRVGGTSVGAIQATLLALGYTPKKCPALFQT